MTGGYECHVDVVERAMSLAEKKLVLHGQNPEHDLQISGQNVHFATAGAAVMIAEPESNRYRDSQAQDLYDMARIADTCEHIHIFQRMCVLRDIPDNYEMDLNTLYCSLMGTSKHVGSSWTDADTPGKITADAAHHRGWRRPLARPPFRQPIQLFRCAAHEVYRGSAQVPATRRRRRHAGPAADRRPGRSNHASLPGRRGFTGLGRMPGRTGLC